jgi:hypothetical protein
MTITGGNVSPHPRKIEGMNVDGPLGPVLVMAELVRLETESMIEPKLADEVTGPEPDMRRARKTPWNPEVDGFVKQYIEESNEIIAILGPWANGGRNSN